jgi:transcriptional regulator with XRE-family HTH domain
MIPQSSTSVSCALDELLLMYLRSGSKLIRVFTLQGAMKAAETTLGRAINAARREKDWNLKDLASKILREDGAAISVQYLNDIEHDRRSPSSDWMVQQLARALNLEADWLYFLAGRFPADLRQSNLSKDDVVKKIQAFRKAPSQRAR